MCGYKCRWEGRVKTCASSLLTASILPLKAGMGNSFATGEKAGG